MSTVNIPNLTGQTATTIREAVFAKWLELSGEEPLPGQPEYLMLEVISFICGLKNQATQSGLEQNLIEFAKGEALDRLAVLWGITRLVNEGDEALRERILLAPSDLSVTGIEEGFISVVKGVDPSITDVSVIAPTPPTVEVRFITKTGLPSPELIAKVQEALEDKKNKPIVVTPLASAPSTINYSISATIDIYTTADVATIRQRCADAANKLREQISSKIGVDVVISQFVTAIGNVTGVYRCTINSPTNDILISSTQWAVAPIVTTSNITIGSTQVG
jgi:phage-related baseplate assembly protein